MRDLGFWGVFCRKGFQHTPAEEKIKVFYFHRAPLYTVEKKNMEKTFSATVSAERQPVKLIDWLKFRSAFSGIGIGWQNILPSLYVLFLFILI